MATIPQILLTAGFLFLVMFIAMGIYIHFAGKRRASHSPPRDKREPSDRSLPDGP